MPRQIFRFSKALTIALLALAVQACDTAPEAAATQAATDTVATAETPAKDIYNYFEYSPSFASAGQPTEAQLKLQQQQGVERVVYLAFSDQERSLPAEDRIVKNLGMNYLQVPVDWKAPQKRDYYLFAQAMQLEPERKTLLHCQANFRASAFALLYRVLSLGVPLVEAKADMNSTWVPNTVWTAFVLEVLAENGVDSNCEGCDWVASTIGE